MPVANAVQLDCCLTTFLAFYLVLVRPFKQPDAETDLERILKMNWKNVQIEEEKPKSSLAKSANEPRGSAPRTKRDTASKRDFRAIVVIRTSTTCLGQRYSGYKNLTIDLTEIA